MAHHCLTQARVAQLIRERTQGRHADGGNLYLRIRGAAAPSWVFLYQLRGERSQREMTLGAVHSITLSRARELAARARDERATGSDPLRKREAKRQAEQAARTAAKSEAEREQRTLAREARRLQELLAPTFRNYKHAQQWINSLEQHVPPAVWNKSIADVTAAELLEFLQPLYVALPETARRVRMRLDNVFDDAMMRGLCAGNPAAAIKKTLTKFSAKRKKGSFAALPYPRLPVFMKDLGAMPGAAPRALEFGVLTAARTGEILGMQWPEVDLRDGIWTIPGERMKGGEPHVVYLSARAADILERVRGLDQRYVFPSAARPGNPLSNMALLMTLRRLAAASETTVHGLCRVTFSTWANERGFRPDVIEACLAHKERDRVRAAYNRAKFDAERKQLMNDWGLFVSGARQASVSNLREVRAAQG